MNLAAFDASEAIAKPDMKTLHLVRHAQAHDPRPQQLDRDRPLTPRGERDALMMGQRLAARSAARPDALLVSPATRTLATAGHLAQALGLGVAHVTVDERLYGASADVMLEVIGEQGAHVASLMLVSHNPGITELARQFHDQLLHMQPGAVVQLEFEVDAWGGLGAAVPLNSAVHVP